jgi:hypothetical protein
MPPTPKGGASSPQGCVWGSQNPQCPHTVRRQHEWQLLQTHRVEELDHENVAVQARGEGDGGGTKI